MRLSCRQLQVKVEELTEERSLQSSAATSTSLLSEIEQSMEAEELEQEREQVLATLSRWHVRSPGDGGGRALDFKGLSLLPVAPLPLGKCLLTHHQPHTSRTDRVLDHS